MSSGTIRLPAKQPIAMHSTTYHCTENNCCHIGRYIDGHIRRLVAVSLLLNGYCTRGCTAFHRQEDGGVLGDEIFATEEHVLVGHSHSAPGHRVHPHGLLHT